MSAFGWLDDYPYAFPRQTYRDRRPLIADVEPRSLAIVPRRSPWYDLETRIMQWVVKQIRDEWDAAYGEGALITWRRIHGVLAR